MAQELYEIPVAAICNKVPQIEWLKTTEIYHFAVLVPEVQHQGVSRAMLPPETLRKVLILVASTSGGC